MRFSQILTNNEKSPHRYDANFSFLLQAKLLVEAVNASAGVNQLLLAGIERVALGANFDLDVLLGGAGLNDFAASTTDRRLFVFRMDTFLHHIHLFLAFVKGQNALYLSNARLYYHTYSRNASIFFVIS